MRRSKANMSVFVAQKWATRFMSKIHGLLDLEVTRPN